jgi:hypothetical protein
MGDSYYQSLVQSDISWSGIPLHTTTLAMSVTHCHLQISTDHIYIKPGRGLQPIHVQYL